MSRNLCSLLGSRPHTSDFELIVNGAFVQFKKGRTDASSSERLTAQREMRMKGNGKTAQSIGGAMHPLTQSSIIVEMHMDSTSHDSGCMNEKAYQPYQVDRDQLSLIVSVSPGVHIFPM